MLCDGCCVVVDVVECLYVGSPSLYVPHLLRLYVHAQ